MAQPQPVVISSSPTVVSTLHNPVPLVLFGVAQVLCGIGMIITDIIYFCVLGTNTAFLYNAFASGLYLGAFFVLTGSFGISAGWPLSTGDSPHSRKCALVTSMVLSILSIFPSVVVMAWMLLIYVGLSERVVVLPINFYFHAIVLVAHLAQSISAGVNLCNMPPQMPVSNLATAQSVYFVPGYSGGIPMSAFNQQPSHGGVAVFPHTMTPQPAFGTASQMRQPGTTGSERNNTFRDIALNS